jgi:hypothetical protein
MVGSKIGVIKKLAFPYRVKKEHKRKNNFCLYVDANSRDTVE